MHVGLIALLLAADWPASASAGGTSWAGANSFYAHALTPSDRAEYLAAMQAAGMRSLRIFISSTGDGDKGSSARAVDDLEKSAVGTYDDAILAQIDDLMYEAVQHGIKLDIAMHDRYALGWWSHDAYVDRYGLPSGQGSQPTKFYTDDEIQAQFDKRLAHILQYPSARFGGRPWGQLTEAVLSFAPQNEAQAHMDSRDWGWWCRRAAAMRPHVASGILISTGGSEGLADGLQPQLYECPQLDVVDIHTYDTNPDTVASSLKQAVSQALGAGKRVRLQEFGFSGADGAKAAALDTLMDVMNQAGVPFLPWQLMKPNNDKDFEFWTQGQTWAKISARSLGALRASSPFSWPEVAAGKRDWELCSVSSECADGCCSAELSDDGALKCTPGGAPDKCVGGGGGGLGDWEACSSSGQCSNHCCSTEFSDDVNLKCTPGGTLVKCLSDGVADWMPCSTSTACANYCCSTEYSDDGELKCTPGGTPAKCVTSAAHAFWPSSSVV